MVLELFLKTKEFHPALTTLTGIVYAIIGSLLAIFLFPQQANIVMLFLTILATIPHIYGLLNNKKAQMSKDFKGMFAQDYIKIAQSIFFLFLGFTLGFTVVFLSASQFSDTAIVTVSENQNIDKAIIGDTEKARLLGDYQVQQREHGWWWNSADLTIIVQSADETIAKRYVQLYPPVQTIPKRMEFVQHDFADYNYKSISKPAYDTFTIEYQKGIVPKAEQIAILPDVKNAVMEKQVLNKIGLVALCILFSFLFGLGAIFIITWNASNLAATIVNAVAQTPTLQIFAHILLQGSLEIVAYLLAGIAGTIVSFGITHYHFKTKKFLKVATDATYLISVSCMLLLAATLIELLF